MSQNTYSIQSNWIESNANGCLGMKSFLSSYNVVLCLLFVCGLCPFVPYANRGRVRYHAVATCVQYLMVGKMLFVGFALSCVFYYESKVIFQDIARTAVQCRRCIETFVHLAAIVTCVVKRKDHGNLLNGLVGLDESIKEHLKVELLKWKLKIS